MPKSTDDAARPRNNEHDNQRPDRSGRPPRPATEPHGAKGSSRTSHTMTDPATGEASR